MRDRNLDEFIIHNLLTKWGQYSIKNGIHTVYILSISENATTISQSRLTTSIVILCAIYLFPESRTVNSRNNVASKANKNWVINMWKNGNDTRSWNSIWGLEEHLKGKTTTANAVACDQEFAHWLISRDLAYRLCSCHNAWEPARRLQSQ